MKRIAAFFMMLVMLLGLTACSGGSGGGAYSYSASKAGSSTVFSCISEGKMTDIACLSLIDNSESKVTVELGMKRSDLVDIFGEDNLTTSSGKKYKKVATAAAYFYFDVNDTEYSQGIISIISLDPIYGFGVNSTADDVKEQLGKPSSSYTAGEDELFFFPYSNGLSADCVTYTQGKNTLKFYFISGSLSATLLCVTDKWETK